VTTSGDLLLRGGIVVPMTTRRHWLVADVLVVDGRVGAIGPRLSPPAGAEVVDVAGCLVLPGFVQTHVHVVQSLARFRADGLPLLRWLVERIWPYEAALSAEWAGVAARLGIAELLLGGTTLALDMGTVHHQERVFAAARDLKIRFVSGKCNMDDGEGVPPGLLESTGTSLAEAEGLARQWHGSADGRLRYAVSPRFILSCSPALLDGAARLARRRGLLLHTHASENSEETNRVRELTGMGSVAALSHHGLGGRDVVLAHCVHLGDDEVDLLAKEGTAVAHCPGSNLKLASGIADVPRLLARGIRVGLGADGPPCNNRLSIFHEMALAGTLHNLAHGADAVDPWAVLEMATWRGAEALGWGGEVGRLVPGARADVVVLGPHSLAMEPSGDPASVIVYGCGAEAVRHVMVDGDLVVRDGRLVTADVAEIRASARTAAAQIDSVLGWRP
jgi:cytosine/adenosine deaminase-related metal-dependent hydrolase